MRDREDANRTREAGHLDEIQGVVANTLNTFRNGAACRVSSFTLVGVIDGLNAKRRIKKYLPSTTRAREEKSRIRRRSELQLMRIQGWKLAP